MDYRTGLPGPGQGAHLLDFVFVNITGGSNVSLICGWKLCILFACSPRVHKGFPPVRTPTEKTCKKNRTLSCPTLTKTDGSLHLVPGRLKGIPLLLGSWRKDSRGWENAEVKFTATSACVCVCVS